MERLCDRHSRDSVRETMLKHEKAFKEQVSELHRIYGVQKSLMAELRKACKLQLHTSSTVGGKPGSERECINQEPQSSFQSLAASSYISYLYDNNWQLVRLADTRAKRQWFQAKDLSSQGANNRYGDTSKLKNFDLERPADEYAADDVNATGEELSDFQRSVVDQLYIDRPHSRLNCTGKDASVELTLSVGGSKEINKKMQWWDCQDPEFGCSLSLSTESRRSIPCNSGWSESVKDQSIEKQRFIKSDEECSDSFDSKSLQHPPWMFQPLPWHKTT